MKRWNVESLSTGTREPDYLNLSPGSASYQRLDRASQVIRLLCASVSLSVKWQWKMYLLLKEIVRINTLIHVKFFKQYLSKYSEGSCFFYCALSSIFRQNTFFVDSMGGGVGSRVRWILEKFIPTLSLFPYLLIRDKHDLPYKVVSHLISWDQIYSHRVLT